MIEVVRKAQIEASRIPKRYLVNQLVPSTKHDGEMFERLKFICDNIKDFVKEGHNLTLYSMNCGNGKTSWACKLGLSYIDSYASNYAIETPVLFVNAAEYINRKKASISDKTLVEEMNELEKNLYKADLVIWDDLATKALSEYDMEQLYVFINYRMANMKSNIFTSNCTEAGMSAIMGKRLGSRVANNSITIELTGLDNRKDKFNFDTMSIN